MKLPYFLLLCASVVVPSLAPAQERGRAVHEAREAQMQPRREFQQDFRRDRDRAERHERHEQRERMSAEERRQLRRDVNDAGREIYRRPQPGRF